MTLNFHHFQSSYLVVVAVSVVVWYEDGWNKSKSSFVDLITITIIIIINNNNDQINNLIDNNQANIYNTNKQWGNEYFCFTFF